MELTGPTRAVLGPAILALAHPVGFLRVIASSMTRPAPWGMSALALTDAFTLSLISLGEAATIA